MKAYGLAALLTVVGSASQADAASGSAQDHASDRDKTARLLTSVELRKGIAPHEGAIGQCYKRFALPATRATGELRLEIIVHRSGSVFRLAVVAPGVSKKDHKALTRCIERSARNWHFEPRQGFTHAVIPFLYQRTRSPGAGPLTSCWNPKGCPELHRQHKRAAR